MENYGVICGIVTQSRNKVRSFVTNLDGLVFSSL